MNRLIIKSFFSLLFLIAGLSQSHAQQKITFYHYDLLGSPVATTDESGAVIWREEYGPWGEKLLNEDVTHDNVRDYTGHVHDRETGLTYMQARYYDPVIGRFMGTDPVGFKEDNPILFNRYAYANNNPYRFIDPNGEEPNDGIGEDFGDPIGYGNDDMSSFHESLPAFADAQSSGIVGGGALSIAETALGGLKFGVMGVKVALGAISNAKVAKEMVEVTVKTINRKTQSGIGVTRHSVQQKIKRHVRSVDELDAIKNPLDVRPMKIDQLGRPSQRFIGRRAEVAHNPKTGNIVSVNPISTKKAERLLRRKGSQ